MCCDHHAIALPQRGCQASRAAGQQRARRPPERAPGTACQHTTLYLHDGFQLSEQSLAHDARRAVFSAFFLCCRVVLWWLHCNCQAYDATHATMQLCYSGLLCSQDVSGPINAVGHSSSRTRVEQCAGRNGTAAALVGVEASTPQQSSASGCRHSGDTSDSFTTNRRYRRCDVFSFRARQAAAAPFCRCNAWPSATMQRLEARFFAPNVQYEWPCPWPGCRNESCL